MSSKSIGRRTVEIGLYSLGLLLFLEVVFRGLFSIDPIFRKLSGYDDSSSRIHWINQHTDQQQFVYKFDAYHPSRGWTLKPGIKDMVVFKNKILNSNSMGFRGKAEYSYARQSGKRRILVFGDSYSFGDEVSDGETYSHYLESIMPDTEVLNLGIHGYGHDQMLLYLQEEGIKYRPDIVILGYVWFDMNRNLFEFNNYSKPKFEILDHELHLVNVSVPSPEWFITHEFYRLKILDLGVILREKIRWTLGLNDERAKTLTTSILREFVRTTRQINATPVFVYLPVLAELIKSDEAMTPNEQYLYKNCEEQKIACLFLRRSFVEEAKKGTTFNTRSHWLANEHSIAAKSIKEFLQTE